MLTRSTQIPTAARGKVRALVKAHKHWKVFLHKKGMLSASAKNADLIEFALFYPELANQIEAIINSDALVAEIEALLREAAKRSTDEYKARRQAQRDEAALNNFNYVGSRHHY